MGQGLVIISQACSWCDGGCCAVQASARGMPESADVGVLVSLCARLSSSAVDLEAK